MEIKELKPQYTTNKSYYKKAHIIYNDNGTIDLKSYNTIVATYEPQKKQFVKHWHGYSRTTMKHIIDFCGQLGIDFKPNKKNWLALPHITKKQYYIKGSNGFCTHDTRNTLIFDNYADAEDYADTMSENLNYFWQYWVEEV